MICLEVVLCASVLHVSTSITADDLLACIGRFVHQGWLI